MINSTDPTGSVNYTADPSAPGGYRQVTTYSPEQQGLYNQETALQGGALSTANKALQGANTALDSPLIPPALRREAGFSQELADSIFGQAKSRLDPMWQQAEDRNRTRLANQGFSQNSTGFDNSMAMLGRDKNDAYNQAIYSSIQQGATQGLNEAQFANEAAQQQYQNEATAQNMPINQLSALLSLGQVQAPNGINYSPAAIGQTDVTGAYGLNAAGNQANAASRQAANNSAMAGAATLAGTAITVF